ncbi:hypothetical protein KP509_03G025300 [Ceratopteris richardii]|uniref:BHLH domain-containing protein n=2 Tax=Euphyllophyta TaxID=78536 RepID=A0A8T2V5C8_CERRI|nr:hypothetical protein KP509_03G025300 [Ceratopteris richardii]
MCSWSGASAMEKNADQIDISLQDSTVTNKMGENREDGNDTSRKVMERDGDDGQGSVDSQHSADLEPLESASQQGVKLVQNQNNVRLNGVVSEESQTSSPQSSVEHGPLNLDHQSNCLDIDPSLDLRDPHRHSSQQAQNHHINHYDLPFHEQDNNQVSASDLHSSPNDSNSCNSSTNLFNTLVVGNSGAPESCGSAHLFTSPSAWPPNSTSAMEETTFFSSSLVNDTTPDLSLTSNSFSKSATQLHADSREDAVYADQKTTLPFLTGHSDLHLPEQTANLAHENPNHAEDSALLMGTSQCGHYQDNSNIHSFTSYLANSPSAMEDEQRPSKQVDFLGAADGCALAGEECTSASGMYHQINDLHLQQHSGDVQHPSYMQYQNAHWHNGLQQEDSDDSYPWYLMSAVHGSAPEMQGAVTLPCGFMTNLMQPHHGSEQYGDGQNHYAGHRQLAHANSLPLFIEHIGTVEHDNVADGHRNHVPLIQRAFGSPGEAIPSPSFHARSGVHHSRYAMIRGPMPSRKIKDDSSVSHYGIHTAPEVDDTDNWVQPGSQMTPSSVSIWKTSHHITKGMNRLSNKRQSPECQEEEKADHQEDSRPLKKSASWDCIGPIYNTASTTSASTTLNEKNLGTTSSQRSCNLSPMHHTTQLPPFINTSIASSGGAPFFSNNSSMQTRQMMRSSIGSSIHTSNIQSSNKQEKPRTRQGIANDPQSIAARHRRERISERLKILQQLVPNGSKVDLVTMLEKAINYVKFLQLQVKVLATDEYWPTPLSKFPKVAAMAKLAADSKEPANLEKVEKALAETIQADS